MSDLREQFEQLKAKGKQLGEEGSKMSSLIDQIGELEDEICRFTDKLEEAGEFGWIDELSDVRYEASAWMPSSMQC